GGVWRTPPQTCTTRSGRGAAKALTDTAVSPQQTWVGYGGLGLPWCRRRGRRGGSGAGHNGVKSLIESLGTDEFVRFRVGIGKPARKGSQSGVHYVLGRFTKAEAERLPHVVDGVVDSLELALAAGGQPASARSNRPR